MPLYEYQCSQCGHRFEKIQKFSDPPVKVCPKCGKRKVSKLVSAPGFQFKGSGWYVTDYAKGHSAGAAAGESKTAEGGAAADSASDTKSETRSKTESASGKKTESTASKAKAEK